MHAQSWLSIDATVASDEVNKTEHFTSLLGLITWYTYHNVNSSEGINRRRGWSSLEVTRSSHHLLCVQCVFVGLCIALSKAVYLGYTSLPIITAEITSHSKSPVCSKPETVSIINK